MKIFDFKNNALFLSCWREKTRKSTVVSFSLILVLIVGLLWLNAYYSEHKAYDYTYNHPYNNQPAHVKLLAWHEKLLLDISVLQGVIILLLGSVSAYRMADRERTSNTLDFHRSSPTPAKHQMLGLIFGSAILEWMLFTALAGLSLLLCFFNPHYFLDVLYFNLCLIFCAFLYHAMAVLTAIFQINRKGSYGFISIIILLYIILHLLMLPKSAFTFHLTWQPAYYYFQSAIQGFHKPSYYWGANSNEILFTLFSVKQPQGLLQFVIQIPLLIFILKGITRKIQHPQSPVLSKDYLLLLLIYVLFFWTSSAFTKIVSPSIYYYSSQNNGIEIELAFFAGLIIIFGFFAAIIATPAQLYYKQGLIKASKLGIKKFQILDDHRSSTGWIMGYCIISWVFFDMYMYLAKIPLTKSFLLFIILMNYPISLNYLCEWFKLSKYHRRPIIIGTIIIITWVIFPIFGSMLENIFKVDKNVELLFTSFSPIVVITEIFRNILPHTASHLKQSSLNIVLLVSTSMTVVSVYLANLQKIRIKR